MQDSLKAISRRRRGRPAPPPPDAMASRRVPPPAICPSGGRVYRATVQARQAQAQQINARASLQQQGQSTGRVDGARWRPHPHELERAAHSLQRLAHSRPRCRLALACSSSRYGRIAVSTKFRRAPVSWLQRARVAARRWRLGGGWAARGRGAGPALPAPSLPPPLEHPPLQQRRALRDAHDQQLSSCERKHLLAPCLAQRLAHRLVRVRGCCGRPARGFVHAAVAAPHVNVASGAVPRSLERVVAGHTSGRRRERERTHWLGRCAGSTPSAGAQPWWQHPLHPMQQPRLFLTWSS